MKKSPSQDGQAPSDDAGVPAENTLFRGYQTLMGPTNHLCCGWLSAKPFYAVPGQQFHKNNCRILFIIDSTELSVSLRGQTDGIDLLDSRCCTFKTYKSALKWLLKDLEEPET
jgi:hypothetical protein